MHNRLFAVACMAALMALGGCERRAPEQGGAQHAQQAQARQQLPVRISVGSYNLNNLPFFVADAKGYFAEAGVAVKTENFAQGGSKVLQALVAGSTDVAVGFYDHTIQMQAKQKQVTAFVLLSRNSGLVLAGRLDTRFDPAMPQTIRGMKIGVTSPGSSSDFFVRHFLARHRIPEASVSLIGVGSGAAAVAALGQGKIDLLVNYDPAATMLETRGIGRILIDARSDEGARQVYGGIYPTSTLYAQDSFIEAHPDLVARIAQAQVKALRFIAETPAEQIVASLPDHYVSGDRATYIRAVDRAKAIFSPDGRFVPADLETPLAVLGAFDASVARANIDLSRTYTNRFVDAAQSPAR